MSTYYYLVCDKDRVSSEVVGGRSFPDRWWADDPEAFTAFLREHGDCKPYPRLASEYSRLQHEYARPYEREDR